MSTSSTEKTYLVYDPKKIGLLQAREDAIGEMDENCIMDYNIRDLNNKLIKGYYPYESNDEIFAINKCLDNHVVGLWSPGKELTKNPCCDFDLAKVNRILLPDKQKGILDDLLDQQKEYYKRPLRGGRKTKVKRRRKKPRKSKKKRSVTSNKI